MKNIRINGVEQEVQSGILVFEDFLTNLNETLGKSNQVISSILVDGKEITESEEAHLRKSQMETVGTVDIITSNPMELAYETLSTLEQYLDRITLSIGRAAMHYKRKSLLSGDTYFSKAIDGLDLFVQTISGVKLALRIGLNPKLALIEASLVSIMNDLLEAKRQNNYVFLAELLENDLIENLKEWKEKAFPLMRNLRSY